jgi:molybdate transport system substrate-binding protein
MNSKWKIGIFILLHLLCGCVPKQEAVTISAAASLKDSLEEIREMFEEKFPGPKIVFNYGGSGMLSRQIEQGAPVDAFLSASSEHMKALVEKELVWERDNQDTPLILNTLVIVSHKEGFHKNVNDVLNNKGRIAIATPETTPAGKYTKEALQKSGLWDVVQNRLVYGKDVRHVLTLVEQQSVVAGFVYGSDAISSQSVEVIGQVDTSLHTPIEYFAAVVRESEKQERASQFVDFLFFPKSQEVFARHGFLLSDSRNDN